MWVLSNQAGSCNLHIPTRSMLLHCSQMASMCQLVASYSAVIGGWQPSISHAGLREQAWLVIGLRCRCICPIACQPSHRKKSTIYTSSAFCSSTVCFLNHAPWFPSTPLCLDHVCAGLASHHPRPASFAISSLMPSGSATLQSTLMLRISTSCAIIPLVVK